MKAASSELVKYLDEMLEAMSKFGVRAALEAGEAGELADGLQILGAVGDATGLIARTAKAFLEFPPMAEEAKKKVLQGEPQ